MIMRNRVYKLRPVVTILLFLFPHFLSAQSQPAPKPMDIRVRLMSVEENSRASQELIADALKAAIRSSKHLTLSDNSPLEINVATLEIPGSNEIIVSLLTAVALPEPVVELAGQHEAFYEAIKMSDDEKPAGGRAFRMYITKEVMRNYRDIHRNDILRVAQDQIKSTCESYVLLLADRHARRSIRK